MRFGILSFAALVGCGGVVQLDNGDAHPGGPDGGIVDPLPDANPEVAPDTGVCLKTSDRVEISLAGRGMDDSCGVYGEDTGPGKHEFTGQIVRTTESTIEIDTCPKAADCAPSTLVTVTARAPGLDLRALKKNSYVKVTAEFVRGWGCTSSLSVSSVATWAGDKNPVDGDRFYLAATDGGRIADVPFNVDTVHTGCFTTKESCGGSPGDADWYHFRFSGTSSAVVPMGETRSFTARGYTVTARNLRAWYEGWCDAYWDYAWWAISP